MTKLVFLIISPGTEGWRRLCLHLGMEGCGFNLAPLRNPNFISGLRVTEAGVMCDDISMSSDHYGRGRHQTPVIQRFYEWLNIVNVHCQHQHQHWKLITFQRRAPKWIWKQFLPKLAIDHHCTSSTQGMRVESWAGTRPGRRGWNLEQANCLPNIGQYNSQFFSLYLSAGTCHQFPDDLRQIAETNSIDHHWLTMLQSGA